MHVEQIWTGYEQRWEVEGEVFDPKQLQRVALDARPTSTLDWKLPEEGMVLWEFDFGPLPPADEPEFLTLQLAVDHFTTEVWPKVEERSFGAVLYRGSPKFDERESLKLLAAHLPEALPPILEFDVKGLDLNEAYRLTSRAEFELFHLSVEGLAGLPAFSEKSQRTPLALCFPENAIDMKPVLEKLEGRPFRLIPERLLTHMWEGVDHLIVFPEALSGQGMRRVLGFEATGGELLTVGQDAQASLPLLQNVPLSSLDAWLKRG